MQRCATNDVTSCVEVEISILQLPPKVKIVASIVSHGSPEVWNVHDAELKQRPNIITDTHIVCILEYVEVEENSLSCWASRIEAQCMTMYDGKQCLPDRLNILQGHSMTRHGFRLVHFLERRSSEPTLGFQLTQPGLGTSVGSEVAAIGTRWSLDLVIPRVAVGSEHVVLFWLMFGPVELWNSSRQFIEGSQHGIVVCDIAGREMQIIRRNL